MFTWSQIASRNVKNVCNPRPIPSGSFALSLLNKPRCYKTAPKKERKQYAGSFVPLTRSYARIPSVLKSIEGLFVPQNVPHSLSRRAQAAKKQGKIFVPKKSIEHVVGEQKSFWLKFKAETKRMWQALAHQGIATFVIDDLVAHHLDGRAFSVKFNREIKQSSYKGFRPTKAWAQDLLASLSMVDAQLRNTRKQRTFSKPPKSSGGKRRIRVFAPKFEDYAETLALLDPRLHIIYLGEVARAQKKDEKSFISAIIGSPEYKLCVPFEIQGNLREGEATDNGFFHYLVEAGHYGQVPVAFVYPELRGKIIDYLRVHNKILPFKYANRAKLTEESYLSLKMKPVDWDSPYADWLRKRQWLHHVKLPESNEEFFSDPDFWFMDNGVVFSGMLRTHYDDMLREKAERDASMSNCRLQSKGDDEPDHERHLDMFQWILDNCNGVGYADFFTVSWCYPTNLLDKLLAHFSFVPVLRNREETRATFALYVNRAKLFMQQINHPYMVQWLNNSAVPLAGLVTRVNADNFNSTFTAYMQCNIHLPGFCTYEDLLNLIEIDQDIIAQNDGLEIEEVKAIPITQFYAENYAAFKRDVNNMSEEVRSQFLTSFQPWVVFHVQGWSDYESDEGFMAQLYEYIKHEIADPARGVITFLQTVFWVAAGALKLGGAIAFDCATMPFRKIYHMIMKHLRPFVSGISGFVSKVKKIVEQFWIVGPIVAFMALFCLVRLWSTTVLTAIVKGFAIAMGTYGLLSVIELIMEFVQKPSSRIPAVFAAESVDELKEIAGETPLPRCVWWMAEQGQSISNNGMWREPIVTPLTLQAFIHACGQYNPCKHGIVMHELVTFQQYMDGYGLRREDKCSLCQQRAEFSGSGRAKQTDVPYVFGDDISDYEKPESPRLISDENMSVLLGAKDKGKEPEFEVQAPGFINTLAGYLEVDPINFSVSAFDKHAARIRNANQYHVFIKHTMDFVLWVRDSCYKAVTGVEWSQRNEKGTVMDFLTHIEEVKQLVNDLEAKPNWLTDVGSITRVTQLSSKNSSLSLKSMCLQNDQQKLLTIAKNTLSALTAQIASRPIPTRKRDPISVLFVGEPGSGKTYASKLLANALGKKFANQDQLERNQLFYVHNPATEYWEGYCGQPVTIHEEFMSTLRPEVNAANALSFLQQASSHAYPLNMANAAMKGAYAFDSRFILLTAMCDKKNIMWQGDNVGLTAIDSIFRRCVTFYAVCKNGEYSYYPATLSVTSNQYVNVEPDLGKKCNLDDIYTYLCDLDRKVERLATIGMTTLVQKADIPDLGTNQTTLVADVRRFNIQGETTALNFIASIKKSLASGFYRAKLHAGQLILSKTELPFTTDGPIIVDPVPVPWLSSDVPKAAIAAAVGILVTVVDLLMHYLKKDGSEFLPQSGAYEPSTLARTRRELRHPEVKRAELKLQGQIETYNAVTNNMFSIVRTKNGERKKLGCGVFLIRHIALMNYHVWCILQANKNLDHEFLFGDGTTFSFKPTTLKAHVMPNDICYVTFPDKDATNRSFQDRKDITHLFPEETLDEVPRGCQLLLLDAHAKRVTIGAEFQRMDRYTNSDVHVTDALVFSVSQPTREGDCGGIYVSMYSPLIFGLHFAGDNYTSSLCSLLRRPKFTMSSQAPHELYLTTSETHIPDKTKIVPSPINSLVGGPLTPLKRPAILAPVVRKNEAGEDVVISPLDKALVKTLNPPDRSKRLDGSDPEFNKFFVRVLRDRFEAPVCSAGKFTWLSQEEAFNGVHDGYVRHMEAINSKTSSGIPFNTRVNGRPVYEAKYWKKGGLMKKVDDKLTFTDVLWQQFKSLLTSRTPKFPPMTACLKDELRKMSKIESVDSRLFFGESILATIFLRRAFGPMIVALKKNRPEPSAIGINPCSMEWSMLYSKLAQCSKVGDADAEKMDVSCGPEWRFFIDFCQRIQEINGCTADMVWEHEGDSFTLTHQQVWHIIRTNFIETLFQVIDVVFVTDSNTSGNTCTPFRNMVSLICAYCYWWWHTAPECVRSDPDVFRRALIFILYGDDQLLGVRPIIADGKTFELKIEDLPVIAARYGWLLTSAKKDQPVGPVALHEITFLKRRFVPDPNSPYNSFLAPVDLDTIREIPLWLYKGDDVKEQMHTMLSALKVHLQMWPEIADEELNRYISACESVGLVIDRSKLHTHYDVLGMERFNL